ncbi:MAG: 2-amino-4-hydroxy-6-hydroxymethyldihydropteridine diphosphokinase [Firmicutes bacterium]|nr:2-amino-4-hydroxy-6-hydroxymethyldihydropteridine diphosphokinase [Bacillota bacterium]
MIWNKINPIIAYLGLGSNLGDREANLRRALQLLVEGPGVTLLKVSPLYETDPVGYTEQGPFLNAVVEIETTLDPHQLLARALHVEDALGRVRPVRWGPRTVDIDILLYGNRTIRDKDLEIPHPRMWQRGFVLVPLADLNPYTDITNITITPGTGGRGLSLRDLLTKEHLEDLGSKGGVRLYKRAWAWV